MLYPIKFEPILKEKIWGGTKLNQLLHKKSQSPNVGESWEISTVPGDISVVSNGDLQGKTLLQLIETYQSDLLGTPIFKQYGMQFPLLLKFIDAKQDLSVQVHPGDQLAKERHNSFGKTEMWYVVQADEKAQLIVDFKEKTSKNAYAEALEAESVEKLLNFIDIEEGSSFFIEAGKIHAIGAGSLIAEIQQTSDITYRVYDWNRTDNQGNSRELHTETGIRCFEL